MQVDSQLPELRAALLDGLRATLTPSQGREAFERHQLLAIRFHRAARVNTPNRKVGEGEGWERYFVDHFPRGGEHAHLLWKDWRTQLLKDEAPGAGIVITHGRHDV